MGNKIRLSMHPRNFGGDNLLATFTMTTFEYNYHNSFGFAFLFKFVNPANKLMDSGSCSTDLPTPKPCKSEVFEKKKSPKTWRFGRPQT